MAPVRVRRSRKASTSERVMRSPMRVPNLLAFSSRVLIQWRTVCSWAPTMPAMSATVSSWCRRIGSGGMTPGSRPATGRGRR